MVLDYNDSNNGNPTLEHDLPEGALKTWNWKLIGVGALRSGRTLSAAGLPTYGCVLSQGTLRARCLACSTGLPCYTHNRCTASVCTG